MSWDQMKKHVEKHAEKQMAVNCIVLYRIFNLSFLVLIS